MVWAAVCGNHRIGGDYITFEEVFTFEHLWKSYKKCRNGVGWKPRVQVFNQNKSDGFYQFTICEKGKIREIKSVTVRERREIKLLFKKTL